MTRKPKQAEGSYCITYPLCNDRKDGWWEGDRKGEFLGDWWLQFLHLLTVRRWAPGAHGTSNVSVKGTSWTRNEWMNERNFTKKLPLGFGRVNMWDGCEMGEESRPERLGSACDYSCGCGCDYASIVFLIRWIYKCRVAVWQFLHVSKLWMGWNKVWDGWGKPTRVIWLWLWSCYLSVKNPSHVHLALIFDALLDTCISLLVSDSGCVLWKLRTFYFQLIHSNVGFKELWT